MKKIKIDLQLFADASYNLGDNSTNTNSAFDYNLQGTFTSGLSPEMKTFYSKDLIETALPNLVHRQFAEHKAMPQHGGKSIEFRQWSSFEKALKPLEEGITPKGSALTVSTITKQLEQFGDYSTLTDVLNMTAIDNTIVQYNAKHAENASLTLDTIARNELITGTNVLYAPIVNADGTTTPVTSRAGLTAAAKLTPDMIAKACTELKKSNAPKIDGSYVAIIHPSVAYDLMRNEEWIDVSKYKNPEKIYNGEIGKLYGVRFVESTESAIVVGDDLSATSRYLTGTTPDSGHNITGKVISVTDTLVADALIGRKVLLYNSTGTGSYELHEVTDNDTSTITVKDSITMTDATYIFPGEGGKETVDGQAAVYMCIFLGKGAYTDIQLEGGNLETIVKPKGSGGTADPLNQRSTVGWKCTMYGVQILIPEYLVRVECGSTYSGIDAKN